MLKQDLAESNSCVLRKTFIYFCQYAIKNLSREFFKNNFLNLYLSLSKDKIATVRIEFSKSISLMKPFFDYDLDLNLELSDIINNLKSDHDREVVEAIEQSDYKLLHQRKKTKDEEK